MADHSVRITESDVTPVTAKENQTIQWINETDVNVVLVGFPWTLKGVWPHDFIAVRAKSSSLVYTLRKPLPVKTRHEYLIRWEAVPSSGADEGDEGFPIKAFRPRTGTIDID